MIGASVKMCPDCGGSGTEAFIVQEGGQITRYLCIRCDGRGETLMTDTQLDSEYPRTEESNGSDD